MPKFMSWYLTYSARPARAAGGETVYGDPMHRLRPPSRVGPVHPTGRASPNTAPVACDRARPPGHDMPDAVACPEPTPGGGTTGSRARHERGETRTPCRRPPDRCRSCLGDHTT